mmetsp:Transcript_37714/g.61402  ORF Transcript_37714/g.61402 Transcript_37714/m.61402 type:complete len:130 (-) Transcript_37714:1460-1849(-)
MPTFGVLFVATPLIQMHTQPFRACLAWLAKRCNTEPLTKFTSTTQALCEYIYWNYSARDLTGHWHKVVVILFRQAKSCSQHLQFFLRLTSSVFKFRLFVPDSQSPSFLSLISIASPMLLESCVKGKTRV